MGWQNDCPAIWWFNVYFDRLGTIQRDSGSVTLTSGISNCSLQNYFENNLLQHSFQNTFFLKSSFPIIYALSIKTIRRRDDRFIKPSYHCIILKIVKFLVLCLSDMAQFCLFFGSKWSFFYFVPTLYLVYHSEF